MRGFEEKVPTHKEMLQAATSEARTTKDSKGKEYYLGPTIGQVVSIYFDKNHGMFETIKKLLLSGKDHTIILAEVQKKSKDMTMHHVMYVGRTI